MDYYQENNTGSRGLALGAMVLAALAVPLFYVFYVSIPLAAIAIILALLSRGRGPISTRGRLAVLIASGTLFFSTLSGAYMMYTVYHSPDLRQQLRDMLDFYYDMFEETEPAENDLDALPDTHPAPQAPAPSDDLPDWMMEGGIEA